MWKKVLRWVGLGLLVLVLAGAAFGYAQVSAFDASMARVYDVRAPSIAASTDPAVIARGKHLAESIGGCESCHGPDLGGRLERPMGPVGTIHGPNLTTGKGGVLSQYSDGQLARLIRDGIKADGRSVVFMPATDFHWWPDADVAAVVSYVRSKPPVDRVIPKPHVGLLGKILDQRNVVPLDVARRIDHSAPRPQAPQPAPTKEYGAFLGKLCQACHGVGLSGGPIPGAPPDLPVPTNITPHASGLAGYTEAEFTKLLDAGIKRNGQPLDPFMPVTALRAMNDIERRALFAYITSLPPRPFGQR